MRPVSPRAAIDTLSWVIQSCSTAPAFSVLQHLMSPPSTPCPGLSVDGLYWVVWLFAVTLLGGLALLYQTELLVLWFHKCLCMQTLPQLSSPLLYLRYRYMSEDMTLLGSCVIWKLVSHIQVRMWVHGGLSRVSGSSPEWQMSHFTWPGSRWSVLAGEEICAACFLNQITYFSQN